MRRVEEAQLFARFHGGDDVFLDLVDEGMEDYRTVKPLTTEDTGEHGGNQKAEVKLQK